jgi:hypothetical protein
MRIAPKIHLSQHVDDEEGDARILDICTLIVCIACKVLHRNVDGIDGKMNVGNEVPPSISRASLDRHWHLLIRQTRFSLCSILPHTILSSAYHISNQL